MESQNLPALIDGASRRLSEARTSGEVLEARNVALAAMHYAKVTKAANDTQADCLRIIVRAEMRMADAIDDGRESGELASQGKPPQSGGLATLDELGVDHRRLSEWRELRDAGHEAVDAAIQSQLAEGKAPTKSGIQAVLAGYTGNNEWYTPEEWIERARTVMGTIDLDPASCEFAQQKIGAAGWFSAEQDGLKQQWGGNVWMNPPYARGLIEPFIDKLAEECAALRVQQAIVLTDNRTDTGWFHKLAAFSSALAFTRGRIGFYNERGPSSSPANGSAFFYVGDNLLRFEEHFGGECLVLKRP